jgi:hypothetical protein
MKETTASPNTRARTSKDAQIAAALASTVVVLGFAVYWIIQIQDVREMLALAYG